MEDKFFKVVMEIKADDEEALEQWLDRIPNGEMIWDCQVVDEDEPHLEARIRYVEDWNGDGEHYLFENRWTNENEWGLESAFPLKDDMIYYTALTKIREWKNLGIPFYFG